MSEDRLEQALEAIRSEDVSPEELSAARTRVWENLERSAISACSELRPEFRDYLDDRLTGSRRLLIEDHLGRCPRCRAMLGELRGEGNVIAMPARRHSRWPRWGAWAAVASLALAMLYLGRDRIDILLAPGGPRATVASLSGDLYRVTGGPLQSGAAIGDREAVRTGPGARAVLELADGSLMEVNERTEVTLRGAWSGHTIQLERGDIIVQAAKQRRSPLKVQTRDSLASVRGTVFAVSAGFAGTVVSVVEGSVEVRQPGVNVTLKPGQQAASKPALAHSVQEAVSWSAEAETWLSLLASFAKLESQIAGLASPDLRTQSRLLESLPANMVAYGALPNLTGTIREGIVLAEQQAAENPVFGQWWNSGPGTELRQLLDRVQSVTPLLGNEIVFGFARAVPGDEEGIPIVTAEVLPGKRVELAGALAGLTEGDGPPLSYFVNDDLMIASDSSAHLQWIVEHLGQGAGSPFAAAIAERYRRGAGWLLALDVEPLIASMPGSIEAEIAGLRQMKHLFLEQRGVSGTEENQVTLTFKGERVGMASWLANSGSGGAAEYVSRDAILSLYASTREPRQLFEELLGRFARPDSSGFVELAELEQKLGIGFTRDVAAAIGTEWALAIEGFSVSGPVWTMAVLVNDPTTLDNSVRRLVELFNSDLRPEDQSHRITLVQESADGHTWTTLRTDNSPLSVTWTYDSGYMVAASDRGTATRAIAMRSAGSSLVFSAALHSRLPSSTGLHPSAFVWLNTKGALQGLEALISNPTLKGLVAERDPILLVFSGATEHIHAASRTRLTSLILDVMMMESLSQARGGSTATFLEGGGNR